MKTDGWRVASYSRLYAHQVPQISGVYTLLKVKRVHGIPVAVDPVYVGQSRNLRRRWREHLGANEPNPSLQWLENEVEFWWTALPEHQLDAAEASLIDELCPAANRRRRRLQQT